MSNKECPISKEEIHFHSLFFMFTVPLLFNKEGLGEILHNTAKIPLSPPLKKGEIYIFSFIRWKFLVEDALQGIGHWTFFFYLLRQFQQIIHRLNFLFNSTGIPTQLRSCNGHYLL